MTPPKGSPAGSPSRRAQKPTPFEREFPGGSESANASLVALVQVGEAFVALLNKGLRGHGLSAAGRQALAILDGAGEPLSPTTIAERLIVTTATVTSLLDTLERRGLIVRQPDPNDRRRLLVSITDDARQIVDEFLPEVVALQTAVMTGLDETQRQELLQSLADIREGMTTVDVDATLKTVRARGKRRPR
jgi:DNA-binding MarR family transcriptional regulator